MNEWIKKRLEQIKALWGKWSLVQKLVFFGVIAASVGGMIFLITFSSAPSMEPLIGVAIQDEQALSQIVLKLDEEGVDYRVSDAGKIYVSDKMTARRMRSILVREDLVPSETDPWELFDTERWTLTDFERNVNLRRSLTKSLEQHIRELEDVDNASVTLVMPEDSLFQEDQNPVTASVVLTPKPGSDLVENRKKVEGIERMIQFAVEGLSAENITILDQRGNELNDFEGLEDLDRLKMAEREMETKADLEETYTKRILRALQEIFSKDRVEIVNLDINLDMSKESYQEEEHFPITLVPDDPTTPYSEYQPIESITLSESSSNEEFKGTGFNPEGPPGQEGQTPPAYKDLSNLVGEYSSTSQTKNEVVNTRKTQGEKSPWKIKRVTVGVAIDGIWKWTYNDRGEVVLESDGSIQRKYLPVEDEQLQKAKELIEHAIGYDELRGDSVSVQHLQFDRTAQFKEEDEVFRRQRQLQRTIFYVIVVLAVSIVAFVAFRLISREIERRRRLREEELSRQHQAMREAALKSAEEEGVDVEMSVQDRARLEMQENAINMAREHPEDVAQLIRSWLAEE